MAVIIPQRFWMRGFTADEQATRNEILYEREFSVELGTFRFKIGDGAEAWNDKLYAGIGLTDLSAIDDGHRLRYDATAGNWTTIDESAASVPYDNTASALAATNVQEAIDEVTALAAGGGGGGGTGSIDIRDVWLMG